MWVSRVVEGNAKSSMCEVEQWISQVKCLVTLGLTAYAEASVLLFLLLLFLRLYTHYMLQ